MAVSQRAQCKDLELEKVKRCAVINHYCVFPGGKKKKLHKRPSVAQVTDVLRWKLTWWRSRSWETTEEEENPGTIKELAYFEREMMFRVPPMSRPFRRQDLKLVAQCHSTGCSPANSPSRLSKAAFFPPESQKTGFWHHSWPDPLPSTNWCLYQKPLPPTQTLPPLGNEVWILIHLYSLQL